MGSWVREVAWVVGRLVLVLLLLLVCGTCAAALHHYLALFPLYALLQADKAAARAWLRSHCISFTFARDELIPNPDFLFPEEVAPPPAETGPAFPISAGAFDAARQAQAAASAGQTPALETSAAPTAGYVPGSTQALREPHSPSYSLTRSLHIVLLPCACIGSMLCPLGYLCWQAACPSSAGCGCRH